MSKLALEKSSFPLAAMLNFSILMSTAVSIWINAPPVLRAWETVKFLSSSLWPCPPFLVILSISGRRKIVARFSKPNNRLKLLYSDHWLNNRPFDNWTVFWSSVYWISPLFGSPLYVFDLAPFDLNFFFPIRSHQGVWRVRAQARARAASSEERGQWDPRGYDGSLESLSPILGTAASGHLESWQLLQVNESYAWSGNTSWNQFHQQYFFAPNTVCFFLLMGCLMTNFLPLIGRYLDYLLP